MSERCAAYREQGARFAKWRAALKVSDVLPSRECVEQNAEQLARYAKVCQEQGLVPIVEPEILITSDYGMARSRDVSTLVLREVFKRLAAHGVDLKTCLLKPQMVMPGEATSPPRLPLSPVSPSTLTAAQFQRPLSVFLAGRVAQDRRAPRRRPRRRSRGRPWTSSTSA